MVGYQLFRYLLWGVGLGSGGFGEGVAVVHSYICAAGGVDYGGAERVFPLEPFHVTIGEQVVRAFQVAQIPDVALEFGGVPGVVVDVAGVIGTLGGQDLLGDALKAGL